MAINKVIKGSTTLIDVTDVGTTAANVAEGVTFIGNDGVKGVGEMTSAGGTTVGELLSNGGTIANYEGTTIDLTGIDTSNRYSFSNFAYNCPNLTSLDGSLIDTSNGQDFSASFMGCASLQTIDVSDWDTSNAINMNNMFSGDNSLAVLDVSDWDVSNVQDTGAMFTGVGAIASGNVTLDVSDWDTSNIQNMAQMFQTTPNTQTLDVSNWDTKSATGMGAMFEESGVTSLDLSSFDTSNVQDCGSMLNNMSNLTTLKLPARFDEIESDLGLDNCTNLTTIYVPTPALSYYTDVNADPHNNYFTDRPSLVSLITGYTAPTTTYTFVTTGGSSVSSITTTDFIQSQSSTADNPDYVLKGWYYDSGFTKKVKFPLLNTNTHQSTITLYAKYGLPNPSTKALAIDIGDMADPTIWEDYTLDNTCQTTSGIFFPDNPRIWFKYTVPSGNGQRIQVNGSNSNSSSMIYTVQNDDGTEYMGSYIWDSCGLIAGNTYYFAIGVDSEIYGEITMSVGFNIWNE